MIFEARFEFFPVNILHRQMQRAGTELKELSDQFGNLFDPELLEVWTEVRGAVAHGLAREEHAGEPLRP
jgi:hypothetical protein